ncbi:MAG: ArsB/NhaD family transporter [Dehalococcoidales bacterium]|nr:ArsB/NhaD family transporter [Dehalococcoidales bacterium]
MLGKAVVSLAARGSLWGILSMTIGTGLGSNLINNWSMMMVSVSSLGAASAHPSQSLIYSSILGADLGPNLTILGSLSSMLWLVLLNKRGLNIHPLQYLKIGLLVTPPMLVVGALGLFVASQL